MDTGDQPAAQAGTTKRAGSTTRTPSTLGVVVHHSMKVDKGITTLPFVGSAFKHEGGLEGGWTTA